MINQFINWLRKNNNLQEAKEIGVKTAFENLFDFWDLVDQAPASTHNKKDDFGISLDILWAEEQIDNAIYKV